MDRTSPILDRVRIFDAGTEGFLERWRAIRTRQEGSSDGALASVRRILDDVARSGDEALARFTREFDGVSVAPGSFRVSAAELAAAGAALPPDVRAALERGRTQLMAYQRHLMPPGVRDFEAGGKTILVLHQPHRRVGVYVPGGRASYPSTVLHTVIPAQVAGVEEIAVFSPPGADGRPSSLVLGACHFLGVEEVYRAGGAQAIGAMAFGTASIPRVDKIVGPGNLYVTLAKKEVYGRVDIDLLAGPTEVVIVADDSADPALVAADLLAQAEHDPAASAVLLTPSRDLAARVAGEVERQLTSLERREIARASIEAFGAAVVVGGLDEAARLSDELAPEHLQIVTRDPRAFLESVRNAGAYFLGPWSPEVAGDYLAGPSHVLPTGGSARFSSGLSVWTFLRHRAAIEYDAEAIRLEAGPIETLALAEGLTGHARAIRMRRGSAEGGLLAGLAVAGVIAALGIWLWNRDAAPTAPADGSAPDSPREAARARARDPLLDKFAGPDRPAGPERPPAGPGLPVDEARDRFVRTLLAEPVQMADATRRADEAARTFDVYVRRPTAALAEIVQALNAELSRLDGAEERDWRIALLGAAGDAARPDERLLEPPEAERLVEILRDPMPVRLSAKAVYLAVVFQVAVIRRSLALAGDEPPWASESSAGFLAGMLPAEGSIPPVPTPGPSAEERLRREVEAYAALCSRRGEVVAAFVAAHVARPLTFESAVEAAREAAGDESALVHRPVERFRTIARGCSRVHAEALGGAQGEDWRIAAALACGTVEIWNRVYAHRETSAQAVAAYRVHLTGQLSTAGDDLARLETLLASPVPAGSPKGLWLEILFEHALIHRTLRYRDVHGLTDDSVGAVDAAWPDEEDPVRRYLETPR